MKLRKLAKMLDWAERIRICDEKANELWAGDINILQAAADTYGDKQQFIKECKKDGELQYIEEMRAVEDYLDYKLDRNEEGGAISVDMYNNNPRIVVYIKKN